MSYHAQQNTQQKSLSFFLIIAFHFLLIWALANGLGIKVATIFHPKPVKITVIEHKIDPVTLPIPKDPAIDRTRRIDISAPDPVDTISLQSDHITADFQLSTPPAPSGTAITKPQILKATTPEYPTAAIRLNEEGTTGMNLYITADGRVAEARLMSSSGSTRLDDAAIKHAQRNWRFTPCTEGNKPVACWFQTKLTWRLENAKR